MPSAGANLPPSRIRIAAGLISDGEGKVLLVRKRGAPFLIQPGGKLEPGETAMETLARELREELGCGLRRAEFIDIYSAPAAHEPDCIVDAALFRAELEGDIRPGAEIEEAVWIDPQHSEQLQIAPLTRDLVFPLVGRQV